MKTLISFFLLTLSAVLIYSCSSSEVAKPEKKEGWFHRTKCKLLKKNDECD